MPKFKAIRDGLIGTTYIRAGEEFLSDVRPSWAEDVVRAPDVKGPKREKKTPASQPGEKDGE